MLLLNKYYDNPKITTFCFIVIHNLTECSTNELRMELTEVSVCEIIVKALKQNCLISNPKVSNINLAYHGFMAVESLIDYYHNDHAVIRGIADRFVEAGLCEVLMSILEKYLPDAVIEYDWVLDFEESDEECVLDYGQGIIRHLSFRDEPTRVRLTKLGAGNWLPELF